MTVYDFKVKHNRYRQQRITNRPIRIVVCKFDIIIDRTVIGQFVIPCSLCLLPVPIVFKPFYVKNLLIINRARTMSINVER